jgi:hypothetical protein
LFRGLIKFPVTIFPIGQKKTTRSDVITHDVSSYRFSGGLAEKASDWYSGGLADQERMTVSLPFNLNSWYDRWLCSVLHQSVTNQWPVCAASPQYLFRAVLLLVSATVELKFPGLIVGSVVQ